MLKYEVKDETKELQQRDPNMNRFIENVMDGFILYSAIKNDFEFIQTIAENQTNEMAMQLISYKLYIELQKTLILEWEDVKDQFSFNEYDDLKSCRACMVISKEFDERFFKKVLWTIAYKQYDNFKKTDKAIDICNDIVKNRFRKIDRLPIINFV